ncbi:hypothetical protein DXM94_01735 [Salmonella enterica]|nr:hypothetical protein [Salmonella enterica]
MVLSKLTGRAGTGRGITVALAVIIITVSLIKQGWGAPLNLGVHAYGSPAEHKVTIRVAYAIVPNNFSQPISVGWVLYHGSGSYVTGVHTEKLLTPTVETVAGGVANWQCKNYHTNCWASGINGALSNGQACSTPMTTYLDRTNLAVLSGAYIDSRDTDKMRETVLDLLNNRSSGDFIYVYSGGDTARPGTNLYDLGDQRATITLTTGGLTVIKKFNNDPNKTALICIYDAYPG